MTEAENIVNDLLKKHNVEDDYARCVFFNWANEYEFSFDSTAKQAWAMESKIVEYVFCKESKEFNLDYHFEFNWNGMFDHDMWLVKSKYNWIPVDYKKQRNTLHPHKPNEYNIHSGNFCTLRDDKISKMCSEELPLVVIDRDIDFRMKNNSRVLFFKKKFDWTEEKFELSDSRHIVVCPVDKLCEMREKKDQVIELVIPKEKRYARNGKEFNGKSLCFSFELFDTIDISEHQKKS